MENPRFELGTSGFLSIALDAVSKAELSRSLIRPAL